MKTFGSSRSRLIAAMGALLLVGMLTVPSQAQYRGGYGGFYGGYRGGGHVGFRGGYGGVRGYGYGGYGLAMAIGLLAGTLNGAAFGKDVVDFSKDTATATNTGQFIAAISVAAFADVAIFKATVDGIFQTMRESATLPGHDPVRIPGDQRGAIFEDRCTNGVPLHPNLIEALSEIAGELQLPALT